MVLVDGTLTLDVPQAVTGDSDGEPASIEREAASQSPN